MINFEVSAVLPAGGIGERTTLDIPKQFYPIHSKPLICYTIEEFERIPWIQKIVVVVPSSHLETMQNIVSEYSYKKILIASGRTSRHRSIAAGIKLLQEDDPEIVIIHDAVRPFVPFEIIKEIVLAAQIHGAAGAIRPLISTVLAKDENDFLSDSLDRTKYFASEMPQAFHFKLISKAYEKCNEYDMEFGTECLQLAHKYCNVRAKLLPGPPELWKVTHKKDFYAAEGIISEFDMTRFLLTVNGNLDLNTLRHIQEKFEIEGNFKLIPSLDKIISSAIIVILHVNDCFTSLEHWCSECFQLPFKQTIIHLLKLDLNTTFSKVISTLKKLNHAAQLNGKNFHFIWITEQEWSDEILQKLISLINGLSKCSSPFSGQLLTV